MGFPWIVYLGLATAKVNPISRLATGKLAKRFVLPRTEIGRSLLRVLFHYPLHEHVSSCSNQRFKNGS